MINEPTRSVKNFNITWFSPSAESSSCNGFEAMVCITLRGIYRLLFNFIEITSALALSRLEVRSYPVIRPSAMYQSIRSRDHELLRMHARVCMCVRTLFET